MRCYISNVFSIFHKMVPKRDLKRDIVLLKEHGKYPPTPLKMIQKSSEEQNEKVRLGSSPSSHFVCVCMAW